MLASIVCYDLLSYVSWNLFLLGETTSFLVHTIILGFSGLCVDARWAFRLMQGTKGTAIKSDGLCTSQTPTKFDGKKLVAIIARDESFRYK